jgi:hypothetical protein
MFVYRQEQGGNGSREAAAVRYEDAHREPFRSGRRVAQDGQMTVYNT